MKFFKDIVSPRGRHWLYRVSIAVLALLAGIGVVTEEMVPLIVGVVGAILAIGVADGNVPDEGEVENVVDIDYSEEDDTDINFNVEERAPKHRKITAAQTPLYTKLAEKWDDRYV